MNPQTNLQAQGHDKDQYDAVVIGSGNAGLTAAVTLQKGGLRTLLLERHNIPGGCATSFVRGDFEFEVALHQLSGLGTEKHPFVMRKVFSDLGIMDKLDVIIERDLYRYVKPGEFDLTLPASWAGLKNTLIEAFPSESESIPKFLKLCETISLETFMMVPKAEKADDPEILKKTCPNFYRYGMATAKDVMDEHFQSEELKAIIAAYWCYMGVPPKDILFPDLAIMLYAYAAFKPAHVKGGSQAISSALLESFTESGGEVRFNCGAEKILTDDYNDKQTVVGVVMENGESVRCDYVVSNASPLHTFNEMLDTDAPAEVSEDFKTRRMGTSAFVIYAGLDCTPDKLGITAASNFIVDEYSEEKAFETMAGIHAPTHSMLTCYNYDDPSFAPEGKSVITLVCLQYSEEWEKLSPEAYANKKFEFAELLINHAEQTFPGIREHLEEVEVATPLTMMRYLNTPGGAIYGYQQNAQDGKYFHERLNQIKGLYLSSAWTSIGGFQPTYMGGQNTGKVVVKKFKQAQELANSSTGQEEVANV